MSTEHDAGVGPRSHAYNELTARLFPGGVSSPVRAFRGVGGEPPVIRKARGAILTDVDGREYIDYVLSWGPLILGHAHEAVVTAACEAARNGSSFGAPTESEVRFAELVVSFFPSMDMLRLVSSGTEAAMTAIRLARGYTGRDVIVKFEGCYHGHVDSLLAAAGSGAATLGIPSTPGVTPGTARDCAATPYHVGGRKSHERQPLRHRPVGTFLCSLPEAIGDPSFRPSSS